MRKLWLAMLCTLASLGTATISEAKIFVNISDGTTTVNALTSTTVPFLKGTGLKLSQLINPPLANADTTTTLNILTCATRPCTVFFPSGAATQQAGDTFKIQDVASTNLARVEVLDSFSSSDRISFKGVKFTSIVTGKVLTVTYGTQGPPAIPVGDLRALTSTQASSYFVSAAFSGSFKTSAGLRATACKAGTVSTDMDTADEACARLAVVLNGTGVDGQGNTVSSTIAVACNNAFPTVNPCGTNGSWTAATGTFTGVNDGRSLSCPSTCSPAQVATLTGRFNGANEVLTLTASLNGVMSNVHDQNGGIEEAALALLGEVGLNRWVTTSATSELCKAVPKAPATNDTRNITNGSSLPISFEYWCGQYSSAGAAGVPLVSLADSALLPGAAGAKYMASRETFLPTPPAGQNTGLQFKKITTFTLSYDVVTTPETDPRLGTVNYSDCVDGSIRVEIQLVDSGGVDKGTMKVYLGSDSTSNFKNLCNAFAGNVDILNNPNARVDATSIQVQNPPTAFAAFSSLQTGQIGNLYVRKIAFIVDRGISGADTTDNFKVNFFDGNVNGTSALQSGALQVVTNFVKVTPTSTNGVYIVITKLNSVTDPNSVGVVKVIPPSDIVINGGKYTTSVKVLDIDAETGQPFSISLCPNGVESGFNPDPQTPNPVVGICIADNARFNFQ